MLASSCEWKSGSKNTGSITQPRERQHREKGGGVEGEEEAAHPTFRQKTPINARWPPRQPAAPLDMGVTHCKASVLRSRIPRHHTHATPAVLPHLCTPHRHSNSHGDHPLFPSPCGRCRSEELAAIRDTTIRVWRHDLLISSPSGFNRRRQPSRQKQMREKSLLVLFVWEDLQDFLEAWQTGGRKSNGKKMKFSRRNWFRSHDEILRGAKNIAWWATRKRV